MFIEIDCGPRDENDAMKGAFAMLVVLDLCIVPFATLIVRTLLLLSVQKQGGMHMSASDRRDDKPG